MVNPLANRTKCIIGKKTVYVSNATSTTTLGEVLADLAVRGHSEAVYISKGSVGSGEIIGTLDFFKSTSTLTLQPPPDSAPENPVVLELMQAYTGE